MASSLRSTVKLTGLIASQLITLQLTTACMKADPVHNTLGKIAPPGAPRSPSAPGPAPAPQPKVSPYEQAGQYCRLAWNWRSVKAAACSNQGSYSYLDFGATDWSNPSSITATQKAYTGTVRAIFVNASTTPGYNGRQNLKFSSSNESTLRMEGVNLGQNSKSPELGYVVLNGNSGQCQPLVTGTPASCYAAFRDAGSYSDTIPLSYFHFEEGKIVSVDGCQLKAKKSESSYSSLAGFVVQGQSACELHGQLVPPGTHVEYDLKDESNYPNFSVRTK